MAFYNSQQDEDQQQQGQTPGAPGVQTQPGSSVITGTGSAPAGGAAAPKTNAPDRPGNFVNLQDYLNANKTQASKLGDQASGVINQSADQARQGVTDFNQEAADKINPVSPLGSDLSDKIKTGAEALTPEQRTQVKNTENAKYTGPSAFGDLVSYQKAADATQKATTNINNSNTEQGRMGLVSQINSKPRTQGENVFDNALLQKGGGREKIANAATANQDVKGGLDAASQVVQNKIGRADDLSTPDVDESSGAIGQTNKAQADAYKQVQDALGAWKTGFEPKVTQAQQNLTDLQNRVTGDISKNPLGLDDETMQLLGLDRGARLYNTDLGSYVNQVSPTDINAGNVASAEDYARYAALADLSGDQSNVLDPNNASKAGTAPTLTANTGKLKSDIDTADQNYEKAYTSQAGAVPLDGIDPSVANYASQFTPEQLENEYIPSLKVGSGNDYLDSQRAAQATQLETALNQWKQNQGFNNILNGYGAGGDKVAPPSSPGHIIIRK